MRTSPLRALAHYKVLPRISSGRAMALAVAARAPYAMIPLGAMTAITASTGSVATGGLATSIVAMATAVASPLIGRWADRRGQRFVLTLLTPLNGLALLTLLAAALLGWVGPALWLACLAVGLTSLPIGSFTRARWVGAATDPRDLSTAFSYESTVDELVFVLGPALVGIAASAAVPSAPLALAAALVILAGIPFALTAPSTTDEAHFGAGPTASVRPSIGRVLWAVAGAIVVMTAIGTFFGSVQAAVTERSEFFGVPGQGGLIYALMGVGSALTALLVVVVPETVKLPTRALVGGLGMAVFITVASAQGSVPLLAASLLGAGLFIGPTMVTGFTLAESRSPHGGTGVAMTAMQSSVTIGVSLGAAVGGALSAQHGGVGAFAVAIAAGLVIAVAGLTMGRSGARAERAERQLDFTSPRR
ncbi:MFS transporter [Tessaracoccus terricola]